MVSLAAVLLFNGCKKNSTTYIDYDYVDPTMARIKINYNVAFNANPAAQIKINGVRVSGTNIKTRYPFPGGGFNTLGGSTGDYLPISAGNAEVSISIPKLGTNVDSVAIFKTNVNAAAGKFYSLHVTDTLERKGMLVEENLTRPDSGFVRYRFANLMANVPAVDLYIGSVLVMANVPFMAISEPFTLPTSQATVSTTWAIRPAGAAATSTALATYNSASTVLNQRVYTVFASGYSGRTDANRKPYVSFYYVL
ncbi:hypothetical protein D9M68_544680 [compost metagenome]